MLEIGGSLAEERRRQGLGVAEVEAATLIRARYIEALEHEQFDLLPLGSYRRSFLRTYAAFLGLSGDVYAEEYDLRLARLRVESPIPTVRRRSRLAVLLAELRLGRVALATAVVALVGVAVWQIGVSSGPARVTAAPPPARPHASPRVRPRASPPLGRLHVVSRPLHRPSLVPRSRPRRRSSLTLTAARGNCWLLVRIGSSAGPTIYEQILEKGQTVRFGLGKLLWIRFGAPGSIDAAIDGHPAGSAALSSPGAVIVTPTGLRAFP